jgi:hypothetical protein
MINALDSCRREKRWDLNELRATKATAKRFRATRIIPGKTTIATMMKPTGPIDSGKKQGSALQ